MRRRKYESLQGELRNSLPTIQHLRLSLNWVATVAHHPLVKLLDSLYPPRFDERIVTFYYLSEPQKPLYFEAEILGHYTGVSFDQFKETARETRHTRFPHFLSLCLRRIRTWFANLRR